MSEQPFATAADLDSRGIDKNAAITAASAQVRELCGWHIWPSITETVRLVDPGSMVMLPTLHLTAVSAVRWDDVAATDFTWHTAGYLTASRTAWPQWHHGVLEVDITHGYETAPDAIVDVVLALAAAVMEDPTGRHTSERLGDYSVGYGPISETHRAVLARYTIPGAA